MNKTESFVHLKAFLEGDQTVERVDLDIEHECLTVIQKHGEPFIISIWGDRECAALKDVVKRFIQIGNLDEYISAPEFIGE